MQLLQLMGWRPGRGVGLRDAAPGASSSAAACGAEAARKAGRWGTVGGVSLDNTPIYVLEPKRDLHGLGFDPFEGAEEFRARRAAGAARAPTEARPGAAAGAGGGAAGGAGGAGGADGRKRPRGAAFGVGALDESDTYGGDLDDYVEAALPRDRRLEAFAYEEASESDDEDRRARARAPARCRRRRPSMPMLAALAPPPLPPPLLTRLPPRRLPRAAAPTPPPPRAGSTPSGRARRRCTLRGPARARWR